MFRLSTRADAQEIFYLLNSPSNLSATLQYVPSESVVDVATKGQFIVRGGSDGLLEVAEHPQEKGVSRYASLTHYTQGPSQLALLLAMIRGLIGSPALLTAYPLGQIAIDGSRGGESLYSLNLIERRWAFPSSYISSEIFFPHEEELFKSSLQLANERRSEVVTALLENYRLCSQMKKELISYDH